MNFELVKGNTYIIDTGMSYIPFYKISSNDIILIDTGWAKGERDGIQEILDKNNFKVKGILCTHAHIDHVGNNAYLKEKYNSIIAMPAYEAFICSSAINLKLFFYSQTMAEVIEHTGSMLCETDILIMPGDEKVSLCGIEFKIIHTPGHSPAHICVITPDNVAYIGDALISYEVMDGAKLPYAFALKEDLLSKNKLFELKCSKYIVSHKGLYDDIAKLITDNIIFYKHRAEVLYNTINGEMSMEDIFITVISKFKIKIGNQYRYSVLERMLRSYVQYLHETGALQLKINDGLLKYSRK